MDMRRSIPLLAVLGLLTPLLAQDESTPDLAAGRLLVASPDLRDPNFAGTVVLPLHHDGQGTMGVIVNRKTKTPLSKAMTSISPEEKPIAASSDPVFSGGPVTPSGGLALLRSTSKPEEATRVFGDVFLVSTRKLVEKSVSDGKPPTEFRLYLGSCGWAPGQLNMEIQMGAWRVLQANAAVVFDPDPDTLWARLVELSRLEIAVLLAPHGNRPGAGARNRLDQIHP